MAGRRATRSFAASIVALLGLALALAGCGGSDDDAQPGLRITREDGSLVEIDRTLRAWCGVPRNQGDAGRSLLVLAGDLPSGDLSDAPSYWTFRIVLEKLERTRRLAVPQVPVDTPSWVFYVNDKERDNEAAAYKEGSSGRIEVERWGCEEGDAVTLTVNARVASEFGDGEAVQARGTVTAEIGGEPEGYSG